MRNVLAVGICLVAGMLGTPAGAQESLLRWHFSGTTALLKEEALATYREVHNMPETTRLRDEILGNLATTVAARFTSQPGRNEGVDASAVLIKPLLQQLLESESRVELTSPANEKADWVLAVRAAREPAQLWSTNLWQLVHASRLGQPQPRDLAGASGWTASGDKYHLAFVQLADWILFAGGHSSPEAHERALAGLRKKLDQKPETPLSLDVNLPAFAALLDKGHLVHAPRFSLTVRPRADGLRSELNLEYGQDLGIRPERWEVPRELIRDPLIGFTAVQGIRARLSGKEEFASLEAEHTPNQLFIWAQSMTPFSITAAARVGNPAEVVDNLAAALKKEGSLVERMALGELRLNEEHDSLIWSGLPIIVPFARPAAKPNENYLEIGLFPLSKTATNVAPSGLFEQLEKDNLVYYAWEITGARIAQWRPLWQMSRFLRNNPIPSSNSASETWLPAVASKLQNTITEATIEGPRSIKIIRQSQLGFNALELVLLAHLADRYDQAAPAPAPAARPGKRPAQRPAPPVQKNPSPRVR